MWQLRIAAACLCLAAAAPLAAQQPSQRQVDSLAAELRSLRARIDSLVVELRRLRAAPAAARRDTAAVQDELAALRAAAAAAAAPAAGAPARDTVKPQVLGGDRNLSQLNPEISATADIRAYGQAEGPQRDNFDAREVEIGFQSALDPFSHTKIFVALEEGSVDIEEGYAYWTGLPGHIRLDVGKWRQQLGELNRWHLHALPETEYPLVLTTYTGDEGLAGTGLSLYRAFGGLGTHEVTLQLTQGSNEVLFDDGSAPAVLGHLTNFWQLSSSIYAQVGATAVYGTNSDVDLKTTLGGVDFRITWRPPARALYREWTLRGEVYGLQKERGGVGQTHYGAYVGTTYKLGRRWIAGLRADYVESPEGGLAIQRQLVPSLTWWQSEWVYLRAQWLYRRLDRVTTNQLALQAVWAIGPHKHETY
jgi:hypothetical protein